MYFQGSFPDEFEVHPRPELVKPSPNTFIPQHLKAVPAPGKTIGRSGIRNLCKCGIPGNRSHAGAEEEKPERVT